MDQPAVNESVSVEVRVGGVLASEFLIQRVEGVKEDNASVNRYHRGLAYEVTIKYTLEDGVPVSERKLCLLGKVSGSKCGMLGSRLCSPPPPIMQSTYLMPW